MRTFQIIEKNGQKGIICLVCDKISYHPKDIMNEYCHNCKQYHHYTLSNNIQINRDKKIDTILEVIV